MANNNEKLWKISRILVPILIALAVAVFAYGRHVERVDTLQKTTIKADANEKAIIGFQKDIHYIKEAVDDIKAELQDARRRTQRTE